MKNLAKLVCLAAVAAVGCVTSEPNDLSTPDAGVLPITASGAVGQASTGGQAGASGGNAGTSGAITNGTAGVTGLAGMGGSGTSGTAGAAGSSGGQGGIAGSKIDAGAPDTKTTSMDGGASTDGAGAEVSAYAATWTDIYNRMLNNMSYPSNCTGGGCHNPGTQKGLDFSTQAKGYTTVKTKLVVGNPGASSIVSQLSAGKMPQGRPKMPAVDLNVIKAWIMAGALNN
jgi:hypothetical protein